jgi:photosystem II stability/assembly factor-like uncharacterized protein
MKAKKLFILFVLLCFACDVDDISQDERCTKTTSDFTTVSGWLQLESTTLNNLSMVTFLNDDFGIASGANGTFLKTNSGGLCWEALDVGVTPHFFSTFIVDENVYYTSRSKVYKTINGGQSFTELTVSEGDSGIFDMHFFDENRGIVFKGPNDLYKTEDGGQSWTNIYPIFGSANNLQFVTDQVGYLSGGSGSDGFSEGQIHKTTDGGNTWFKIETEEIEKSFIGALYFVNEDLGYFFNDDKEFYVSQNGGLTWTLRATIDDFILETVFINASLGYAVGGISIYKTEDAGVTWTVDYVSENVEDDLYGITKTPSGSIFVVGKNGTLLKKE